MIVTTIEESVRYCGLSANLDKAFAWLKSGVYANLPEGRHEIDGEKVFALVSKYETKPFDLCKFETHKNYIDVQSAIAGREEIEVTTMEDMEVLTPYKPDVAFWTLGKPREVHKVSLQPGVLLVAYPEDVHKPGISPAGVSGPMRKVVVKVAV
jgi:YhcH/YjgK/YiaL family protein